MRHRMLTAILALMTVGQVTAQKQTLRDLFKQTPDSLMPCLSQNNRLDFIDFIDSNMKAEVVNLLGGKSEMTSLADDSLSIRMTPVSKVDLLLLPLDHPSTDSISRVVVMVETWYADSVHGESRVRYFSPAWKPLSAPVLSVAQVERVSQHNLQNILKKDDDELNKR